MADQATILSWKYRETKKKTYFYLRTIRHTTLNRSSLPGALCPPTSSRFSLVRRCFGCQSGSGPWAGSSMLLMIAGVYRYNGDSFPAGASRTSDGVRFGLFRGNFLCGWFSRSHRISQDFPGLPSFDTGWITSRTIWFCQMQTKWLLCFNTHAISMYVVAYCVSR